MLKIEILADLSDVQIGMFSVERDKIRNPFYYFIFIWALAGYFSSQRPRSES